MGLINSSGEIVGWIDSNMDSLATKLPEMIDQLNSNEIVVLSRYAEGGEDQRKGVRILSGEFYKTLKYIEKNDWVYLDPPYAPLSSTANFTQYTKIDFDSFK